MRMLKELASEISSKNAGNYFLTFDIVFEDHKTYERVKRSRAITPESVARLYGVDVDRITHFAEFDQANAIKVTMRRPITSGDIGESDVFGAQQYIPLLNLPIPWEDEEG